MSILFNHQFSPLNWVPKHQPDGGEDDRDPVHLKGMTSFQKLYCFIDYNKGKIGVLLVLAGLALFVFSGGTAVAAIPLLIAFSPAPMIGIGMAGAGGVSAILSMLYSDYDFEYPSGYARVDGMVEEDSEGAPAPRIVSRAQLTSTATSVGGFRDSYTKPITPRDANAGKPTGHRARGAAQTGSGMTDNRPGNGGQGNDPAPGSGASQTSSGNLGAEQPRHTRLNTTDNSNDRAMFEQTVVLKPGSNPRVGLSSTLSAFSSASRSSVESSESGSSQSPAPTAFSSSSPSSVSTEVSSYSPSSVSTEVSSFSPSSVSTEVSSFSPSSVSTEVSSSSSSSVSTGVSSYSPSSVSTEVSSFSPSSVSTKVSGSSQSSAPTEVSGSSQNPTLTAAASSPSQSSSSSSSSSSLDRPLPPPTYIHTQSN